MLFLWGCSWNVPSICLAYQTLLPKLANWIFWRCPFLAVTWKWPGHRLESWVSPFYVKLRLAEKQLQCVLLERNYCSGSRLIFPEEPLHASGRPLPAPCWNHALLSSAASHRWQCFLADSKVELITNLQPYFGFYKIRMNHLCVDMPLAWITVALYSQSLRNPLWSWGAPGRLCIVVLTSHHADIFSWKFLALCSSVKKSKKKKLFPSWNNSSN